MKRGVAAASSPFRESVRNTDLHVLYHMDGPKWDQLHNNKPLRLRKSEDVTNEELQVNVTNEDVLQLDHSRASADDEVQPDPQG